MAIHSHQPRTPLGWFRALRRRYPDWYVRSPRSEAHPRPWPLGFRPQTDPVFAHNELPIPGVAPARIFDLLVHAESWPKYYDDCADVRIETWAVAASAARQFHRPGATGLAAAILKAALVARLDRPSAKPDVLQLGTRFRWETFAVPQRSEVTLCEPDRALGWRAVSLGTRAYHRWMLAPEGDGTRVVTEECQNGLVAWIDQHWMNPSLHATHQLWLEELKSRALGLK